MKLKLKVSKKAVKNFAKVIERERGVKIKNPKKFLLEQLMLDAESGFDSYAFMIAEDQSSLDNSKFVAE